MNGYIFDIKHFAVHDGPGIRTTVFFKGCPLRCLWCHNPESISGVVQLGYVEHNCTHCKRCVTDCPTGAHYVTDEGRHAFDREKCIKCGKCTQVCYGKNLTLYGREMSADEMLDELLWDEDFYSSSNGGVTLSGGECLIQADFCAELLKMLKEKNIHTAVDTCGFVSSDALDKVMPYTDLFLYDVKAYDEDVHKKCTGVSNKVILENLKYLDGKGCKTEIRIPFVPGYNSDQIGKIGEFLSELKNVVGVRILPYHNYASSKYKSLDMKNTLPVTLPTEEDISEAKNIISSLGLKVFE